jgi:hypothetical protein
MQNGHDFAEAQKWLGLARGSLRDKTVAVGYVYQHAHQAGATLEDLGTSEEELANMRKVGHRQEAAFWLNLARERCCEEDVTSLIGYLREHASKAGITLADLGTSEEELAGLLKTGHQQEAAKWLRFIRERAPRSDITSLIGYLREHASKAGITLADLGTWEADLEALRKQGCMEEARSALLMARAHRKEAAVHLERMRRYLAAAGVGPEAIGITEQELESLVAKN